MLLQRYRFISILIAINDRIITQSNIDKNKAYELNTALHNDFFSLQFQRQSLL